MKRGVPPGWGAGMAESGWWVGWKRYLVNTLSRFFDGTFDGTS